MAIDLSLKGFGRATVAILRTLIGPLVGEDALCQMLGYIENAGAPTALAPEFVGQKLYDTTNNEWYIASSTSTGGWTKIPRTFPQQAAQTAKTTSTTLTAAELLTRIITGNQGAAGAATYTLPLATDLETALLALAPDLKVNDSFDFSVINISTNAAETVTIATNTGWTLVGDVTMAAVAVGDQSGGLFRVRRTAANAYTLYRIG